MIVGAPWPEILIGLLIRESLVAGDDNWHVPCINSRKDGVERHFLFPFDTVFPAGNRSGTGRPRLRASGQLLLRVPTRCPWAHPARSGSSSGVSANTSMPDDRKDNRACPGFVIDHVVALKHGGRDVPANMQWQPREAALAKDRVE